jgi:signal transduction histidine kinase
LLDRAPRTTVEWLSRAPSPAEQLDLLSEASHALGSAFHQQGLTGSLLRSLDALIPGADAIRVFLADRAGRLRLAAVHGDRGETGRRRSHRRREAFVTGVPVRLGQDPAEPPVDLALVPMVARGEALGLLEVKAPSAQLEASWPAVLALAGQAAGAVRGLRTTEHLAGAVEALEGSSALAADLMVAGTRVDALRSALRFCAARFGPPVAVWLAEASPMHLSIRGVRGPRAVARQIREELPSVPRWAVATQSQREDVLRRFGEFAGDEPPIAADAGDALLLVGHVPPALEPAVAAVGRILGAALDHLGDVESTTLRNETLDTGLALTAHEVRAPLVGAKAAIEAVMKTNDLDRRSSELLGAATKELTELSGTLDGLMRWAVYNEPLRRRRVELVGVVREAVSTCHHDGRVAISSAVDQVSVLADRAQLRSALGNVVRNALTHAPASPVDVHIKRWDGRVRVSVRDRGPGVLEEERKSLFDPFVRGSSGGRGGRGLGLFITRRVVEAHGGMVWIDPGDPGATVNLELPVESGETL